MKKLVFLLPLVLLGCSHREAAEKNRLDFGKFSLAVPETWRSFSGQGYDSMVGGVTDGQDTLRFDYGWYSYRFQNETPATHRRTETRIDNRDALIVQPLRPGEGVFGVYVQVDAQNRFNLTGRNLRDEETALAIGRSVTFP